MTVNALEPVQIKGKLRPDTFLEPHHVRHLEFFFVCLKEI